MVLGSAEVVSIRVSELKNYVKNISWEKFICGIYIFQEGIW